ncbi:hypothetical protein BCR12_03110 [Limnothrix sp. P13C2]|nr:hypothetical protein BCR12_03110 [Limnothrix sp. P13C2]
MEELKGYSWVDQLMGAVKAVEQFCRSRSPRKTRWLVPLASRTGAIDGRINFVMVLYRSSATLAHLIPIPPKKIWSIGLTNPNF